jgi:hypothetical protein
MKLPRHACLYCALLAIIAFTSAAHAQVNHHEHTGSMPVGYHEFRFFGGDGRYYLSHFPMFSSIHAFQYVVEVVLSEEAKQAVAKDEREDVARKRRYQLSPYRKGSVSSVRAEDEEDWVLPDTLQSGKAINGDIFYLEGKDRRIVSRNADVKIKAIVWKQELNPKFPRPTALTYVLFGTPKAAFLAHQISAPPKPGKQETDFDQVLSVELLTSSKELLPVTEGKLVIASGVDNLEKNKLQPKQRIKLSLLGNEQQFIEVVVKDELQMEQLTTQR